MMAAPCAAAPSAAGHAAPLLILAVGNPSRGDDAVGPLLAERLQAWLSRQGQGWRDAVELITDQQLVVEHVLDIQGRQRVLFVDAAAQGAPGAQLRALPGLPAASTLPPEAGPLVTSHQCSPTQLLALHQHVLGTPAPPADLLSVTGQQFELGQGLSPAAQAGIEAAWGLLQGWLGSAGAPAAAGDRLSP